MKIGILSQSMGRNYGGILQQYALSKYLESLGHSVIILNRQPNNGGAFKRAILQCLKHVGVKRYQTSGTKEGNIDRFINREFIISKPLYSGLSLSKVCKKEHLDAVIYGSDQIWRRAFELRYGLDYFGASTPLSIRQIAYAPSFGLDVWEYTAKETANIKKTLNNFYAISSREESGVKLISDFLGLKASLVCDPTMLLEKEHYEKLTPYQFPQNPYCFVYWLGDKESMDSVINDYTNRGEKKEIIAINLRDRKELPGIEQWLGYIKNAEYVITDSFHGTVFAILFKKQFEVHCNKSGGYGRIQTLLGQLGLTKKLSDLQAPVDFSKVDDAVMAFRHHSQDYLIKALQ